MGVVCSSAQWWVECIRLRILPLVEHVHGRPRREMGWRLAQTAGFAFKKSASIKGIGHNPGVTVVNLHVIVLGDIDDLSFGCVSGLQDLDGLTGAIDAPDEDRQADNQEQEAQQNERDANKGCHHGEGEHKPDGAEDNTQEQENPTGYRPCVGDQQAGEITLWHLARRRRRHGQVADPRCMALRPRQRCAAVFAVGLKMLEGGSTPGTGDHDFDFSIVGCRWWHSGWRLTIRPVALQTFGRNTLHALAVRADQVTISIAVQEGEAAFVSDEMLAQIFGGDGVTVKLFFPGGEEVIVTLHELAAVGLCDPIEVADHPAGGLEIPLVCQSDEAVSGGDVGKEGKLPAADSTVIPLTVVRTFAGQQLHVGRGFRQGAFGSL
jgi:hypothetical protein